MVFEGILRNDLLYLCEVRRLSEVSNMIGVDSCKLLYVSKCLEDGSTEICLKGCEFIIHLVAKSILHPHNELIDEPAEVNLAQ